MYFMKSVQKNGYDCAADNKLDRKTVAKALFLLHLNKKVAKKTYVFKMEDINGLGLPGRRLPQRKL